MIDPERYEANRAGPARDSQFYIRRMIGEMSWGRNENVMDYGCGTGVTGAQLILPAVESSDSKLFSVDMSKEMVDFAMKTYGNPRVTYAVGNVLSDDFPFNDIQFDKIFCVYVLHFVRDYRKALERFHGLLKPRGYLGFTIFISKMMEINRTLGVDPKWSQYLKGYETFIPEWADKTENIRDLFKRSLEDVRFEIISLEVQKRNFNFPKFESLIEAHLSLNPFLKKIPDHLQSDFKQEHRNFLLQHCNVELKGDGAQINYAVLYGVVKKL